MLGCQALVSCILRLELGFLLENGIISIIVFVHGVKRDLKRIFMNRMATSDTASEN